MSLCIYIRPSSSRHPDAYVIDSALRVAHEHVAPWADRVMAYIADPAGHSLSDTVWRLMWATGPRRHEWTTATVSGGFAYFDTGHADLLCIDNAGRICT